MKTYYFTCTSGHIGGSGVVRAKTKTEALLLANKVIETEGIKGQSITLEDLHVLRPGEAVLITDGNY